MRLDKLLSPDTNQRCAGRAGRLDKTETALFAMATMEETVNSGQDADESRPRRKQGKEISV